jgi:uncharacterized membrane protein (DUF373 family)
MLIEYIEKFEKLIYGTLIVMLMAVLVFALVDLASTIYKAVITPPIGMILNSELTHLLGVFLLVLIGIELLDTIRAYFREKTIHVEIVVLLAIIAISRKIILLEPASTNGPEQIGIGVVIIGLAASYYLIKKAGIEFGKKPVA